MSVKLRRGLLSPGIPTIAELSFSPSPGEFVTFPVTVIITTPTDGCTIYWSNDGQDPYTHPTGIGTGSTATATVAAGQTLKAQAFRTSYFPSLIASGAYTVIAPCADPTFSPSGGVFATFPLSVTISTTTSAATIHYQIGSGSVLAYSGPVSVAAGDTLHAYVTKSGRPNSATVSATYTQTPTCATPTVTPTSGVSPLLITFNCTTPGATIWATFDGSVPSPGSSYAYSDGGSGTVYTGTVRLMAAAPGYLNSAEGTAGTYTAPPPPGPTACTDPWFQPPDGHTYNTHNLVNIKVFTTDYDSGASLTKIRYTWDGTIPTRDYGTKINTFTRVGDGTMWGYAQLPPPHILRAIAFMNDGSRPDSNMTSALYHYA